MSTDLEESVPTVGDVVAFLRSLYPETTAEDWDVVGLTLGHLDAPASRLLLAVDPLPDVVDEAIHCEATLLITHHPLMLRGVTNLDPRSVVGYNTHRLIEHGIALYTAHTNADAASGGVNDALASALGLQEVSILDEQRQSDLLLITYAPAEVADQVRSALATAGAGQFGKYSECSFSHVGTGRFVAGSAAQPSVGFTEEATQVQEERIEVRCTQSILDDVTAALHRAHPYEEVAHAVIPLKPERTGIGIGRVGDLPEPVSLAEFATRVAQVLPGTAHGVRVAGDRGRIVSRVAVSSGSGQSYLAAATASGADAFVTADLRHHPASDLLAAQYVEDRSGFEHHGTQSAITSVPGMAILDVSHWASEWVWLPHLAAQLQDHALTQGWTLDVNVSKTNTDPWDFHV